jgi:putative membrane protein
MFHDFMFGGMWFGWIFWVIIIALIIWLLINQSSRNRQNYQPPQQESALDILKKRYARGEINKDEFEEKKKDLS